MSGEINLQRILVLECRDDKFDVVNVDISSSVGFMQIVEFEHYKLE